MVSRGAASSPPSPGHDNGTIPINIATTSFELDRTLVAEGIFVGLSTVDIVYGVRQFPSANSKVVASSQDIFAGGPAANAAITFSHLGGKATLVTAVGQHAIGGLIREECARYGVQMIDITPRSTDPPAISSITVDEAGQRNVVWINAVRSAAVDYVVDASRVRNAAVVLVDGHNMKACQAWASAARRSKVRVVMDGGSWKVGTDKLLRNVDTAICSADFLPPGCPTLVEVVGYLRRYGVWQVAVTNGAEPIEFRSDSLLGEIPVPRVTSVDTMGAGDIFHGAFCYYISVGADFPEALRQAAWIATRSTQFRGPRQWMALWHCRPGPVRPRSARVGFGIVPGPGEEVEVASVVGLGNVGGVQRSVAAFE